MPSPGRKIFDAESESLYDFVSKNGRGLYIPPYQRDYAWDKSNIERLVDDTIQGLNALLKRPDESVTFLGTIIAMNDSKKATINPLVKNQVYTQVMSIIDGQQRLTTLLMLCLALYVEIEVQWADLRKGAVEATEEAKQWLETHINDTRGLLSQMLSEQQNNGEGEYRYFPKMIRAFIDTWSYEAEKAKYQSPIAWLLFEFVRFRQADAPAWSKFSDEMRKLVDEAGGESQRRHIVKMIKVMRAKLEELPADDEFPDLLEIANDDKKQETLIGEELPDSVKAALKVCLRPVEADEANPLNQPKIREWWLSSCNLISLLFFAKFALERITLVVVTATTEDFAFDVFEALNTTGQPLTALETFVPKVVQSVGMTKYNSSEEKKQLDITFNYIRQFSRAEERQARSADLLVSFALAELGEKRSKNLADQRRFMRDAFDRCKDGAEQKEFIRHLAELARFFNSVWTSKDAKPKVADQVVPEPAAMCLSFLADFQHTITVPLLAQYAAVISAAKQSEEREVALNAFCEVVQAVTAFTVLWRASRSTTDRIDDVYRDLMFKGAENHGVDALARGRRQGKLLPEPSAIRAALVGRLKAVRKDGGGAIQGKEDWIENTAKQPLYDVNTTLARFLLLAAFDDVVDEAGGKLIRGKSGAHVTLTCESWVDPKFTTVEHIAPQSKANGWSADLYKEEEYDRLGNLTLLPAKTNSSLSDRPWSQKKALYGALSAKTEDRAKEIIGGLLAQGVDLTELGTSIYSGQYLPHVHAVSQVEGDWGLEAVSARGRELADLAWGRLAPWLGMPT